MEKPSMTFIFYYIYNNLNIPHIIVSHHEAERVINVSITGYAVTVEIEHTSNNISRIITTAAFSASLVKTSIKEK